MKRTRTEILERCGKLTEAQLQDPVCPGTWSVLQSLAHLAFAEEYMLAWIKRRPHVLPRDEFPPRPAEELPALRFALDEAHAGVIAFVKAHPEAVLRERCQSDLPGEHTVGGILFHLIEHEIHHRGFIRHKLAKLQRAGASS
jgi:uncharacterized damage-inducible protein DinB